MLLAYGLPAVGVDLVEVQYEFDVGCRSRAGIRAPDRHDVSRPVGDRVPVGGDEFTSLDPRVSILVLPAQGEGERSLLHEFWEVGRRRLDVSGDLSGLGGLVEGEVGAVGVQGKTTLAKERDVAKRRRFVETEIGTQLGGARDRQPRGVRRVHGDGVRHLEGKRPVDG